MQVDPVEYNQCLDVFTFAVDMKSVKYLMFLLQIDRCQDIYDGVTFEDIRFFPILY